MNGRTSSKTRSRRMRKKRIPPSLLKLCEGHWGRRVDRQGRFAGLRADRAGDPTIPNLDLPWGEWKRIIMAIWAAFAGNVDGLAAAHAFSRKSSDKYNAEGTDQAWDEVTGSPPSNLSAGTLIYMADQAAPGWRNDHDNGVENDANAAETSTDAKAPEPEPDKRLGEPASEPEADAEAEDHRPLTGRSSAKPHITASSARWSRPSNPRARPTRSRSSSSSSSPSATSLAVKLSIKSSPIGTIRTCSPRW